MAASGTMRSRGLSRRPRRRRDQPRAGASGVVIGAQDVHDRPDMAYQTFVNQAAVQIHLANQL